MTHTNALATFKSTKLVVCNQPRIIETDIHTFMTVTISINGFIETESFLSLRFIPDPKIIDFNKNEFRSRDYEFQTETVGRG